MTSAISGNSPGSDSFEHFDASWYQTAYPDVAVLGIDPLDHYRRYGKLLGRQPAPAERRLKRVALIVPDLSNIGGIASRTRRLLEHTRGRDVDYVALTARAEFGSNRSYEHCHAQDPERFASETSSWFPNETALVVSNNAIRAFPRPIQDWMFCFPIVYICAGQMAFMLQDSNVLKDRAYAKRMRAMRIMSFSDGDIAFQRQLGIHGQVKGFAPVEQRQANTFDPEINTRLGYVGRMDFHTKDVGRLLDVAAELAGSRWGPLLIFTTDGRNSPAYQSFRRLVEEAGLEDQFEIVINCTDKSEIFRTLAFLLVPSRKESFGNSIVEALSFGVPVISTSYAPGPADIIEHGTSGFLLDNYSGAEIAGVLSQIDEMKLLELSRHAFERHKCYQISDHIEQLEELCRMAVTEFEGENILPIFPNLRILED